MNKHIVTFKLTRVSRKSTRGTEHGLRDKHWVTLTCGSYFYVGRRTSFFGMCGWICGLFPHVTYASMDEAVRHGIESALAPNEDGVKHYKARKGKVRRMAVYI